MKWRSIRGLVLLLVTLALGWTLWNSMQRIQQTGLSGEICGALTRNDFDTAISASSGLLARELKASDRSLLEAAECRCLALVGAGEREICSQEIADLTARPALEKWVPQPVLAAAAIDQLEEMGHLQRAMELARAAATQHPESSLFHSREFRVRSRADFAEMGGGYQDRKALLLEFEERLERLGSRAGDLPVLLASRYVESGLWQRALKALGAQPPSDPRLHKEWFQLRTEVFAGLGDARGLASSFEQWELALGSSAKLSARRALTFSLGNLGSAASVMRGLSEAVHNEEQIDDIGLRIAVRRRLIESLTLAERFDEALSLFDETDEKYGPQKSWGRSKITRLERAAASGAEPTDEFGTIRFRGLGATDRLMVSPGDWADGNTPFEEIPTDEAVTRRIDPERSVWWVALDASGVAVGEGAVWPEAGAERIIDVVRRQPTLREASWLLAERAATVRPASAKGQRRVVQLILDSADWRVLHLLMAAGRVPAFERLLTTSAVGSLTSDPPYTAAALQTLTKPGERTFGVVQLAYQFGKEVEALRFVGRNPAAGLAFLTPDVSTVFETLGAGALRTVNLLRSTGSLSAGGNAVVTGPNGETHQLTGHLGSRKLTALEKAALPALQRFRLDVFEEPAADFDTINRVLEGGEIDFISARIASLDLVTHGQYAEIVAGGQRRAIPALLLFYQYLDYRLAQLTGLLGKEDFLIVMSDHGTRSSLEHDPQAVFLLNGPGVVAGPFEGRPDIAGVSRVVAELLGVETTWPDTGLLQLVDLTR